MPSTQKYGIFGTNEVLIDEDGFIEVPVIVQESGLFAGRPPAELRIHSMGIYGDDSFNKRYVAKLNRRTDLPFYLASARIKVISGMVKITDDDLAKLGLERLEDDK